MNSNPTLVFSRYSYDVIHVLTKLKNLLVPCYRGWDTAGIVDRHLVG